MAAERNASSLKHLGVAMSFLEGRVGEGVHTSLVPDSVEKLPRNVLVDIKAGEVMAMAAVRSKEFLSQLKIKRVDVQDYFKPETDGPVEELIESSSERVYDKILKMAGADETVKILRDAHALSESVLNGYSDDAKKIISTLSSELEQRAA